MEIGLPRGENGALEDVIKKKRKVNSEGQLIDKHNTNIILDSR